LTSSTPHDEDDDSLRLESLGDAAYFPWGQDLSYESIELAAQDDCPLWTDPPNVNCRTERRDHVSLQDVELHHMNSERDDVVMQLSCYDLDASFGFSDIQTQTQVRNTNHSEAVPQSLQLPYRHNHGLRHSRHGRNGDDRCPRNSPRSRSNAVIRDWYFTHSSSPYPSPDEIAALATLSGKSEHQVKICLSNLRARAKPGQYSCPSVAMIRD
jgi:hypothetical protein